MTDVTIEMCKSRADAEERKEQIKAMAPGIGFSSRIIEDVVTLAVFQTPTAAPGGVITKLADTTAAALNVAAAAILIIWTE
ncbi:hypothetical protein [Hyphomonas chukchiensis]|uniref:Uncharacterized protein n=1 Tax=Hyphomonas chukchiensis TaxID=1280947 RepID=A0A062UKV0_9PROT|nr:hypothetical protein [Hyphomonas chukchiensis]KCZ56730.1 hypothetical protein HY30_06325 [Hyphomonas chukchiensis]